MSMWTDNRRCRASSLPEFDSKQVIDEKFRGNSLRDGHLVAILSFRGSERRNFLLAFGGPPDSVTVDAKW